MQYYRCKCGKREAYSSGMIPADCDGCSECNTTLEFHPSLHKVLQHHEFITKYDEDTGAPYEICKKCFQRKEEIENGN